MNFKQNLIYKIFGPIIFYFEDKLHISGLFIGVIFIALISIPILKYKKKTDMDIARIILIIVAFFVGLIIAVIHTLKIRGKIL